MPAPATAVEGRRAIDLRSLAKLNPTQVLDDSATYTYYSAQSSVAAASGYYESELQSRGWQPVSTPQPDNPQYRDRLFTRDGYYLRLTIGESGDAGVVGISLANLGNVDLRQLPRMDGAEAHPASTPVQVIYQTDRGIPQAVEFCRQQLSRLGWHEYGDLWVNPPEAPHVKQLSFCRNAVCLMVTVIRDPRLPNSDTTQVSYMAHKVLPYDIPVMDQAQELKLDSIHGRAEYRTPAPLPNVVDYYRQVAPQVAWTVRPDGVQAGDHAAQILVQEDDELGFAIEISRRDDQTLVAFHRISFAEADPADADPPEPGDVAAQQPDASTREPATPPLGDLAGELEQALRDELADVQGQLQQLDGDAAGVLQDAIKQAAEQLAQEDEPAVDEDPEETPAQQQALEAADQLLETLEKLETRCTLYYGDARIALPHALAIRRLDDGSPIIMFCQKPLDAKRAGRQRARGEDVSILDLTGSGFPPSIEIRLEKDFTSISCFVEGASINRGSSDFTSDFQAGSRRLRGQVAMPQPEDVFDKPFRFEAQFDQEFLQPVSASDDGGSEDSLAADSQYDLPIPEGCQEVSQSRSPYRSTMEASIDRPLAHLLAFYRRELPRQGWSEEQPGTEASDSHARLVFAGNPRGPLVVVLRQEGETTTLQLALRNDKKAAEDKMVPAKGQGLLLLANASDAPVGVTIGRRTVNLPAGKGARNPRDAVRVPVLPGKHRLTIGSGAEASREEVTVELGTTWGVVVLPDGGVLAHILY